MEMLIFEKLNLSKDVLKAISEMGFEEATPIQSLAIPPILEGKDVIGQAQTGTGKTCAFGIPAIEMIDYNNENVQVLILCPTRELAIQTAEELKEVSKYKKGIKILPIYGGQQIDRQIMALKRRPQIIIGTPGRVMDHMRRNTLKVAGIKMLVLDEADEMLNMGFREDIDIILQGIPEKRQTLLFSATMAREILDLTVKYQKQPVMLKASHKQLTVPNIEQFYLEVNENLKVEVLSRIIDVNNIKLALVFCNTKKRVDELSYHMQSRGYNAEALHGDMKQALRDKVMAQFRKGTVEILIATDVAARGIDVDNVEAVFNYDIPNDEEYYVHRVGRTGRAGRTGSAYTFVSGREIYKLKDIQRYTKSVILPQKAPTATDVEESKISNIASKLKDTISEGNLKRYIDVIEKILKDDSLSEGEDNYLTTLDIAAAFLKMAIKANSDTKDSPEPEPDLSHATGAEKGMARLFINVGSGNNVQKREIIEAISNNTSLTGKLIGRIDILEKFSFIEVPSEYAPELLTMMKSVKIKGKKINIEKANKRESRN